MGNFQTTEDDRLYLQMMQDNITRMSANSANSKAWLVTIVAAFLAIGCNIDDFDYWLLLAIAPICVFWYLDAYYLNIERGLRNREQRFINICKDVVLDDEDASIPKTKEDALFVFKTLQKKTRQQWSWLCQNRMYVFKLHCLACICNNVCNSHSCYSYFKWMLYLMLL